MVELDEVKIGLLARLLIHNLRTASDKEATLNILKTTEFPTIFDDIYKEKARRLVAEKTEEMIDIIRSKCPLINTDILLKDVIRQSLLRDLGKNLDIRYLREKAVYAGQQAVIGYNAAVNGFAAGADANHILHSGAGGGATPPTPGAGPYAAAAAAAVVVNQVMVLPSDKVQLVIKTSAAAARATIGYIIAITGFNGGADANHIYYSDGGVTRRTPGAGPYAALAAAVVVLNHIEDIDPAVSGPLVIKTGSAAARATIGYNAAVNGFGAGADANHILYSGGGDTPATVEAGPYAAIAAAVVVLNHTEDIDPAVSGPLVIKTSAAATRATIGYNNGTDSKKFAAAIAAGSAVIAHKADIVPTACGQLITKANDEAAYAVDDDNFRKDGYIQSYFIPIKWYTEQLNAIADKLKALPTEPALKQLLVGGASKKKPSLKKKKRRIIKSKKPKTKKTIKKK
jgi:hypothetical protein